MDRTDDNLDRLCEVYLDLNEGEKEKIIKLAEGLLNSQLIISDKKAKLKEKINILGSIK